MFFCNHFQILFFQKIFVFKLVMRDSTTSKLRLLEIAAKILIDKNVADIHHWRSSGNSEDDYMKVEWCCCFGRFQNKVEVKIAREMLSRF